MAPGAGSAPLDEVVVAVEGPFDLRATLAHGTTWRRASLVAEGAVWRAVRTPAGPATVRYRPTDGAVVVTAWGDGAGWALERAAATIGAEDRGWDLRVEHPVVDRALRAAAARRWPRTGVVAEAVISVVFGQKVPSREAHRARDRMAARLGDPPPGPAPIGLRLPPAPERVAEVPFHEFHRLGVERKRAATIRRAAARARRLDEAAAMTTPDAFRRLRGVEGIGPWTCGKVLGATLGDPDVVILGDYNYPDHVVHALTGRRTGSDQEMLDLLAPYGGQRGRVQRALLAAAPPPARHGPRLAPPDITAL